MIKMIFLNLRNILAFHGDSLTKHFDENNNQWRMMSHHEKIMIDYLLHSKSVLIIIGLMAV